MKVRDIMYTTLYRIDAGSTVQEAAKALNKQAIGALLVVKDSQEVGIITDRDIVRKVVALDRDPAIIRVREVMSAPMVSVGKDDDINHVISMFIKYNIKRVPVVYGGEVVGIISTRIIAKHMKRILDR